MGESWAGPESRLELLEGKSWTGLLDGRGVSAELDNRAARWEREGGRLDGAAGWERAAGTRWSCWMGKRWTGLVVDERAQAVHSMKLLNGAAGRERSG